MVDPLLGDGHNGDDRTQPTQAVETFTDLVDDEQAVEEMLSYFPARDVEEPVTKEFLRAELQTEVGAVRIEIADVRASLADVRTELQTEVGAVRIEVGELRAEMREELGVVRGEVAGLRTEMHKEFGAVRVEIRDLRAEMHQMMRTALVWLVGTGISFGGLIVALDRFG